MSPPRFSASYRPISLMLLAIVTLLLQANAATTVYIHGQAYKVNRTISRDACIIGGGSSGTYAAIRLTDLGRSVVVVEEEGRLGGHTETYHDPSGLSINYGVLLWHNLTVVQNYFARLNVNLTRFVPPVAALQFADFTTGKINPHFTPADPSDALMAYASQLGRYSFLRTGYNLPNPVPQDLLLPFGEFVSKYHLDEIVELVYSFCQGQAEFLSQPTLYVMKCFGFNQFDSIRNGFLVAERGDSSLLYESAAEVLFDNVLYDTEVIAMQRSHRTPIASQARMSKVIVASKSGELTLILTNKIITAMPPAIRNFAGWDLNARERSLFGHWRSSNYFTGILRDTGLQTGLHINNRSPNTLHNLPDLPATYQFVFAQTRDLFQFKFASPGALSNEDVKSRVLADLRRLRQATANMVAPEFVTFSGHNPFHLTVPAPLISNGFYRDLRELQGERNTFYIGGAFESHDSSAIWQHIEGLLPDLTA